MRVLKSFTDERPCLTLSEVTASAGLNKSTVYRVLAALEAEGLVERVPGREAYRLGPEAITLGARALRSIDLREAARSELVRLSRELGETATLEVLVEGHVLILDEVKEAGQLGTRVEIGTRWPAYATSTGKVMLAALEDLGQPLPVAERMARLAPNTVRDEVGLRKELARVRRAGYGTAFEELLEGYAAVGAGIRDHDGQVVAAVGLGGPSSRLTRKRLASAGEAVRDAAERISARLGAPARRGTDPERGGGASREPSG